MKQNIGEKNKLCYFISVGFSVKAKSEKMDTKVRRKQEGVSQAVGGVKARS